MQSTMKRTFCGLLVLALLLTGALAAGSGTLRSYPGITVMQPDWITDCLTGAELAEINLEGETFADPAEEAAFWASYNNVLFYMGTYDLEPDTELYLIGSCDGDYIVRGWLSDELMGDAAADELSDYDSVTSFGQMSDEAFRTLVQRFNATYRKGMARMAEEYRADVGEDEYYEYLLEEAGRDPYTAYICANGKYLRTANEWQDVWMSVEEAGEVVFESWEDIGDFFTIEGGKLYYFEYAVGGEPAQREAFKVRIEEIINSVTYTDRPATTPAEPVEQPVQPTVTVSFRDMEKHWAKAEVGRAVEAGLFSGVSEDTFSPDTAATRAQLVTALYRMAGSPETGTCDFTDVKETDWFAKAVAWAAEQGIVQGSDGKFNPYGALTREELAVMLQRFARSRGYAAAGTELVLDAYKDQDKVSSWAAEAMRWAVSQKLINGMTTDTLVPAGTTTRAQLAVILMRYLDAEPNFAQA